MEPAPSVAAAAAGLLPAQGYSPLGDYGVIGDCRSIALVSARGSVDWLCLPHFSSPSWFAALLDAEHGGRFAVTLTDLQRAEQSYLPDTNILRTLLHGPAGALQLTDCVAVVASGDIGAQLAPEHEMVRLLECTAGTVEVLVTFDPRPNYARNRVRLRSRGRLGWQCSHEGEVAFLQSDIPLTQNMRGILSGSVRLNAGERPQLILSYCENDVGIIAPLGGEMEHRVQGTERYWHEWCGRAHYDGPYRDAVMRSALALKLLTYSLSGAVIAAATTSLPEGHGAGRNWDYRYCWLRDTSLVLQSFIDLGFYTESEAFLGWLLHATRLTQPRLQVLYDIYGETALTEYELPHLCGYRGQGPVRIGNDAHTQLQLDIYGDTMQTAFDFVDRSGTLDFYEQRLLIGFGRTVLQLWRQPDASIWEIRAAPRHNTYSKLMCWVALDRLLQLDTRLGLGLNRSAYEQALHDIRTDIDRNAYHAGRNTYVGYYGGEAADASLLLMARYGFLAANDPRMVGTHHYIEEQLGVDGLLYRYPPGATYDGIAGEENLFGICSFWLVDYLARLGERQAAAALFERLLGLANRLGLYAEEFDALSKEPLGNFPQAFTHVGLITAALSLQQAERGESGKEISR